MKKKDIFIFSMGLGIGLVLPFIIIPFFLDSEWFEKVIGSFISGIIGIGSAIFMLNRQKNIERNERLEKEEVEKQNMTNFYHSVLTIAFQEAAMHMATELQQLALFDVSNLKELKKDAFLKLNGKAGRVASNVYTVMEETNLRIAELLAPRRVFGHQADVDNNVRMAANVVFVKFKLKEILEYEEDFFDVIKTLGYEIKLVKAEQTILEVIEKNKLREKEIINSLEKK